MKKQLGAKGLGTMKQDVTLIAILVVLVFLALGVVMLYAIYLQREIDAIMKMAGTL